MWKITRNSVVKFKKKASEGKATVEKKIYDPLKRSRILYKNNRRDPFVSDQWK